MKYMKKTLLFIFLLISVHAFSQVTIQFIPEIYGNSLSGLTSARIFNTGPRQDVRLKITLTEAKAGKIAVLQTVPFTLIQGNNSIPSAAIRSAQLSISSNGTGIFVQRNQYFPQGLYEFEFELISTNVNTQVLANQIFNQEIVPPAPLSLLEPYNSDQICEKRPFLTWMPNIPQATGILYELLLVEIKEDQNKTEALNYNLPIINQKGIIATTLMYPPISKELFEGKKYAWQVSAYKDQTLINRSEVWEFKVSCTNEDTSIEIDLGYRDIEDLAKGNYYVAQGNIKFALVNPYMEQKLKYEITCITDSKIRVRNLPKIILKRGLNKIKIDLSHNLTFRDGYSYILKTFFDNGSSKSLRFTYKEQQ
jgi:hypothetical protein